MGHIEPESEGKVAQTAPINRDGCQMGHLVAVNPGKVAQTTPIIRNGCQVAIELCRSCDAPGMTRDAPGMTREEWSAIGNPRSIAGPSRVHRGSIGNGLWLVLFCLARGRVPRRRILLFPIDALRIAVVALPFGGAILAMLFRQALRLGRLRRVRHASFPYTACKGGEHGYEACSKAL